MKSGRPVTGTQEPRLPASPVQGREATTPTRSVVFGAAATYQLHGVVVESEFALDARRLEGIPETPDYVVRDGGIREAGAAPPGGRLVAELRFPGYGYSAVESPARPEAWTIRYDGSAQFVIDRGTNTITVHPESAEGRRIVPVLLGTNVLAHVLAREGELVLHASSVELGGRALAILGGVGAGKSTLAGLVCGAGARLVSDDMLRVDLSEGAPRCFRGTGLVRLRPAAAALASEIAGAEVIETADGRVGVIPAPTPSDRPPLGAVLVPAPSREARELEVGRLEAREALVELLRYPRLTAWRTRGPIRAHFDGAARLAQAVPLYRATIPWGPPFAAGLAEELLGAVGMGGR